MKTITCTRITYERISKAVIEGHGFDRSNSVQNKNGTVSFPVDDDIYKGLNEYRIKSNLKNFDEAIMTMLTENQRS